MRTFRTLLICGVAALALSACSSEDQPAAESTPSTTTSVTPSTESTPAPTGTPTGPSTTQTPPRLPNGNEPVTLTRTGGFAGVSDTWTVAADGTWTFADRAGKTRTGKLTADQRAQLTALLRNPALIAEVTKANKPPKCMDGFVYSLTIGADRYTIEPCGELRPTFSQLTTLVQSTTTA